MGCLFSCFRARDVDQTHEDSNNVQQSQEPNVTTNIIPQAGLSPFLQDLILRCDALTGKGAKGVNYSQIEPEGVLESNKLIPEKLEGFVAPEDDECLICLEEYTSENPKITTKCSHDYHLGCILDWKERSQLCPVCQKVMVFEEMN